MISVLLVRNNRNSDLDFNKKRFAGLPLHFREKVTLVYQNDIHFGFVYLLHIGLEILTAEHEWVATIHNLHDDVTTRER